jgi:hypothetical protein
VLEIVYKSGGNRSLAAHAYRLHPPMLDHRFNVLNRTPQLLHRLFWSVIKSVLLKRRHLKVLYLQSLTFSNRDNNT